MDIRARHIELVEQVNNAKDEREHSARQFYLDGWRDGLFSAGVNLSLMAADQHYLDQGVDRPMCCGVFLDWQAA
jgi:hypothetical protein